MHNEAEGGERGRGCTFSRPKSRSLSGKEEGRDFSSLELAVPIIERPNLLNASVVDRFVRLSRKLQTLLIVSKRFTELLSG